MDIAVELQFREKIHFVPATQGEGRVIRKGVAYTIAPFAPKSFGVGALQVGVNSNAR